ncbi:unnamed protein product [Choristocarpus tenellus]
MLESKLQELRCAASQDGTDFVVKLERLFSEFEELKEPKSENMKRASILLGIKEAMPHVIAQLITRSDISYEERKRAIISSTTYLHSGQDGHDGVLAMHGNVRNGHAWKARGSAGSGLNPNQCAYCLKMNHQRRKCHSYLNGEPPATRPPGMAPARTFLPPPTGGSSNKVDGNQARSFSTFKVTADEEVNKSAVFNSSSGRQVDILCDSGANVHLTPDHEDLISTKRTCTFGNNGKLEAAPDHQEPSSISEAPWRGRLTANGCLHKTCKSGK